MADAVTVHVERRAVCPSCGTAFDSMVIPAHSNADAERACPRVERDARASVIVFRRNGTELAVINDGAELTGFFTADESIEVGGG